MLRSKFLLVCALSLLGCTTSSSTYIAMLPVPLLLPAPDARAYSPLRGDMVPEAMLMYRDSVSSYRDYLDRYLHDNFQPMLHDLPEGSKECRIVTDKPLPDAHLPPPPDVHGYTDDEIIEALLDYVHELRNNSADYQREVQTYLANLKTQC